MNNGWLTTELRLKIFLYRTMQICACTRAHGPYLNGSEFSNWHRCFFVWLFSLNEMSVNKYPVHMLKMHPPESSCRSFVYTEKASCYKNKCGCMWYSHSYIIRLSAAVPVVSALKEWSVGWMIITAVCDITELSNQRGTKLSEDSCHNTADIGGKDVKQKKRCFMWREDSKKIKVSRIETLLHPEEFLLLWSPENWTLLPHCRGNMELTSSLWPSPGLLEIILPLCECVWACWRVCVCALWQHGKLYSLWWFCGM